MNETICKHERENAKFSFSHLKSKNSPIWHIEIDHHSFEDRNYRDRIRMYKDGCNSNQTLTIICFNPGKLHSKKEQIYRDTTLRNIREVFESSNRILEILNVFNINESKMEKVKEMYQNGEINKIKNNYSIKDYLSPHEEGDLVFIQWGKEGKKEYAKKEFTEIRNLLVELNFDIRSLPEDDSYMHPRCWSMDKKEDGRERRINICKHCLEGILRSRHEKPKK